MENQFLDFILLQLFDYSIMIVLNFCQLNSELVY